jgi:hypothetical protein
MNYLVAINGVYLLIWCLIAHAQILMRSYIHKSICWSIKADLCFQDTFWKNFLPMGCPDMLRLDVIAMATDLSTILHIWATRYSMKWNYQTMVLWTEITKQWLDQCFDITRRMALWNDITKQWWCTFEIKCFFPLMRAQTTWQRLVLTTF